jgi:hypothetical protein
MVKETTEEITCRYSVVHLRETQDALASRLFDDRLQIGALPGAELRVVLDADPEAVEIARRFEGMRMEAALTQVQHQLRFQQWDDLRREVLAVPHRARLWWLDGRSDRLEQLVTMGNVFEEAAALLTPAPRTAQASSSAAQLSDVVDRFLRELEPAQRQLLLQQLSRVFVSYARHDLADATQEVARMVGAADVGGLSLAASAVETGSEENPGHETIRGYP